MGDLGISIGLIDTSLFEKEVESFLAKVEKKYKLNIGFDPNMIRNLEGQIKQIEQQMKSLSSTPIPLFNGKELEEAGIKVRYSIDEIEKELRALGKVETKPKKIFDPITKELVAFELEVKKAEGIIENFKYKTINMLNSEGNIEKGVFILAKNTETDKREELANRRKHALEKAEATAIRKIHEKSYKDRIVQQNRLYTSLDNLMKQEYATKIKMLGKDEESTREYQKQLNLIKQKETVTRNILNNSKLNSLELERNLTEKKTFLESDYKIANIRKTNASNYIGEEVNLKTPINIKPSTEQLQNYIRQVGGVKAEFKSAMPTVDNFNNKILQVHYKIKEGGTHWRNYALTLNETTQRANLLDKGLTDVHNRQLSFSESLKIAVERIGQWGLATMAVYGSFNQIRQGITNINELNKSLTEISIVTGKNQKEVWQLGKEYLELGKNMKVGTQDIATASVEFYRQGLKQEDVMNRTRKATEYAKISNLEFKESAEILTATVNSMNVPIERASDVFAFLGDETASGADEIGKAYQKVGGSAGALGIEFEKVASWIAVVSSKTRESGETIGQSIKGILARVQSLKERGFDEEDGTQINQVSKALASIGIELIDKKGQFRDFGKVMDELGTKWVNIDSRTKAYIATTVAGKVIACL